MIKPNLGNEEHHQDESMTPMIDVIFTLIAFMMLMINAPLLTMELDLPETDNNASVAVADPKNVTVVILAEEELWQLERGDPVGRELLIEALQNLQQKNTDIQVLLTTDKTTHVQRLVTTINILNELEITGSQIAINPDKA